MVKHQKNLDDLVWTENKIRMQKINFKLNEIPR